MKANVLPYLPLYNAHFFSQNEHVNTRCVLYTIHGVLLVKQRKIWSEIWGCVLYTTAHYTWVNTVYKRQSINHEIATIIFSCFKINLG